MTSRENFTYGPPLQGRNIRLINLRLGSEETTLEINLVEQVLGEAKFEALSYVWGNQAAAKQRIICNGRNFYVAVNLLDALVARAHRRLTQFLWADAICINQEDEREKTRQVRMMRDIYSSAEKVTIWLGHDETGDREGYELARNLYQKFDGAKFSESGTRYDFGSFQHRYKGVLEPLFNSTWDALFRIVSHSWFSRVWVVQELLVANKSVMWRGLLDLDMSIMVWITMQIGRHRDLYHAFDIFMGSPPTSALAARSIATGYYIYKEDGPVAIYDTLSRYSGSQATDPRDRYFALAGISAGIDPGFVNYGKSFREVACLVGKMALLGLPTYTLGPGGSEVLIRPPNKPTGDHRFLIEWLAFHANPQNHRLGIPSWIPDLISPHSPGLVLSGFCNTLYMAGERRIPLPKLRLRKGAEFNWAGTSLDQWMIPVPDTELSKLEATQEIDIMGAAFDCVGQLARDRPPLPRMHGQSQEEARRAIQSGVKIGVQDAHEAVARYEGDMVSWLSHIRRLMDPTLRTSNNTSIMAGTAASFDAFWRTLVYNRGQEFDPCSAPNQKADKSLGVSFGCWYLWKKLTMQKKPLLPGDDDGDDYLFSAVFSQILQSLGGPFEEAEGRVRDVRRFFVSGAGRFGWALHRTQVGDRVCVFRGMRIPVIMRQCGSRWEVIGAAYVHGCMDGEIWDIDGLV